MPRVPPGGDRTPQDSTSWRLDVPAGVGVVLRDEQRLVTTATALTAFGEFLAAAGDHRVVVGRH